MKRELLRKSNSSNDEYLTDDTINSEKNTITKILATTSILLGGVAAYKKGAFKKVNSLLLESADLYRKNSLNIAPTIKTFNKWANMYNLETKNADSIFRNNTIKNIKGVFNKEQRKNLISHTKNDLSDLTFRIQKTRETAKKTNNLNKNEYLNTELLEEIRKINKISDQFKNYPNGEATSKRAKMMMSENLHKKIKLTKEESKQQIKRTGYRSLTLDDVIEVISDGKGNRTITSKRSDFNLDKDSKDILTNFMETTRITETKPDGKKVRGKIIETNSWKDFAIDNNIMINDKGNIVDVRYMSENKNDFIRSLANDYQIPMLGFNPLRFFGFDQVGKKESKYGIIHLNTIQNALTGKQGKKVLGQYGEYGNKPLLFLDGKVFKFDDTKAAKVTVIKENMKAERLSYTTNSYGIRSDLNAYRKMVGINTKQYELYTKEDGAIKEMYSKIMKTLDLGFQDRDSSIAQTKRIIDANGNEKIVPLNDDITIFSLKNFTEKLTDKIASMLPKPYKDVTEKTKISNVFGVVGKEEDLYLLKHKDTSITDVMKNKDTETISKYAKEFYAGRKNPDQISEKGMWIYSLADRLNQTLSGLGVGLGMDSIGSTSEIMTNLALKRFLPIYGAYQTMQYVTYLSERDDENKSNIQKDIADAFVAVDLNMHRLKDKLGITDVIKRLTELTPGSDNITELPGLYHLGLDKTYEEQQKYYQSGMDVVRKGRFWELGNCVVPWQKLQTGYGKTTLACDIHIMDNVITHEGVIKKVLDVITRRMNDDEYAPTIELHTTFLTNTTTDNHPYLAVKKKYCPSSSYVDCRPDRCSKYCKEEKYKCCSKRNEWNSDWVLARSLEIGDYLAYPRIKILNENTHINNIEANREVGYMLGLFLAEGNIHTWHKNGSVYGIEIALNESEIVIANKFKNILEKYFPDTKTYIEDNFDKKIIKVRNMSREVGEWFAKTLYVDKEKIFVNDIYKYNEEFVKGVLEGIIDGDGHYQFNKKSLSIHYTSARLEYAVMVRNILFTFGIPNSLVQHNNNLNGKKYKGYRICVTGDAAINLNEILNLYKTKINEYKKNNIASKYIVVDDEYVYIKIKNIYDSGYKGIVYDYHIQDSHSFCSLSTIMHNTPFTGGKVSYYRPNWYRRIQGDVMYSDSLYGSREEYFDNAWFSSPFKHFVTDRYHYDKKHYEDRPYMITSTGFENVPIIGDLLSSTIGRILKPPKKMHEEYWEASATNNVSSEEANQTGVIANSEVAIDQDSTTNKGSSSLSRVQNIDAKQGIKGIVYTTPSGQNAIYDAGENNVDTINSSVKESSINSIDGVEKVNLTEKEFTQGSEDIHNPTSLQTSMASQYTNLTNLTGMTGYFVETFLTGTPMEEAQVYDTMAYATSFNKSFWDQEIGGIGGELSEIFRRFIPEKNKDFEYINPIKNTMPSWLPDDEYMTDFTVGDPYTKVKWGEGRLPGEGYERLWGIEGKDSFEDYDTIDKVRILADIAPWSDQYKDQSKLLREEMKQKEANHEDVSDLKLELEEIEDRVSKQKEPLRVYDYKFKTANLISEEVEIDQVIDDGVFTIKGDEEKSYKLGGIDINAGMDEETKSQYLNYLNDTIHEGNKITLKLDANELKRKPTGINDSVKAIVVDGDKNLNKELIRNGYANVKEDDDSTIGVNVKYSAFDKMIGSVWERLSHLDIFYPINTKLLQVKSPLERYEKNVVYGEDFQEWDRPIDNFLKPAINRAIEHPLGLIIAPAIGAMFGRKRSSKMLGGLLGFGAALFGKAYAKTSEVVTGETWIPKDRKEETDIDEYVDKLKYIKNMKLYDEYSKKALKEDDFDVKNYQRQQQEKAEKNKNRLKEIDQYKKDMNYGKTDIYEVADDNEDYKLSKKEKRELKKQERKEKQQIIVSAAKSMMHFKDNGKRLEILKNRFSEYMSLDDKYEARTQRKMKKKMNDEANEIKNDRSVEELPENAMIALQYYEQAQQTVYGYDQGESVQNLMKAIPKIERDYFKYFANAPEEEQGRILEVIPGYLKNAMLSMWGKNTQKESLTEYFKEHQLPDEKWLGWDENVNLDSVRVKMVEKAGKEFSSFNIWDDDIKEADSQEIPIPHLYQEGNDNLTKSKLKSILQDNGYEDVTIRTKPSLGNNINFNVKNDARPYVSKKLKDEQMY